MNIEDYGFIGDTETGALVGRDGSIDWLCVPRFDSDACFAALLGTAENGFWRIAPEAEEGVKTQRRYRGDTMILETEFATADGAVRLVDFMPPDDHATDLVRVVEGVRGRVRMRMKLVIRFDYGATVPWVRRCEGGVLAIAGPNALLLRSDVETRGEGFSTVAEFEIAEGERRTFVLTWFPSHLDAPPAIDADEQLRETEKFWTEWTNRCSHRGPWREAVVRSLLTLKALTFAPTGGIVAALTTSLPEQLGGERNWDYRYCWVRDATLTLHALTSTGYTDEAAAWCEWLLRAVSGDPEHIQIMYGLGGERRLKEYELPHLAGYENSKPVRVGNAAAGQFQLDVSGEVIGAMYEARAAGVELSETFRTLMRHIVDAVCAHWHEPDEGIWEVRGPRKHFVQSKVMAWAALDRAITAAREEGRADDIERWTKVRDEVHAEVCARGFCEKKNAFTQHYETDELDASVLTLALVGFLPPDDPRVRGTIEAIERELMQDGFVLRYRHIERFSGVDGLPPGEGTFLACSFWLASCLHLIGRTDDARALFERLLAIRNDLGLLAEEYNPQLRRHLGNFPQAFSHIGIVNTARMLCGSHPAGCDEGKAAR